MRNLLWGMVVGAVAMWLWLNGLQPIVDTVAGTWSAVSRPPDAAQAAH